MKSIINYLVLYFEKECISMHQLPVFHIFLQFFGIFTVENLFRFPFPGKVVSLAIDSGTSASDLLLRLAEYFLGGIYCKDVRNVYSQLFFHLPCAILEVFFVKSFIKYISRINLHIFVDHIFCSPN